MTLHPVVSDDGSMPFRRPERPLLTPEERHKILVAWNDTATPYPAETIHALFEAQAAQTPDRVALVFGGTTLSYGELNRRANHVAHRLRALGGVPDAPIGLFARRSLEMVIATLGILKAGGAYVPVDPALPEARLLWTLEDAGISRMVTAGAEPASALPGITLLRAGEVAGERDGDPLPRGSPDSLAYLLYTSGSTGTPKGVCVVHRGVVRLVKNTHYARIDAEQVFLHLAPLAFDASTFELWGPLLNGGRLVLFPAELPSPERIGEIRADLLLVRAGDVSEPYEGFPALEEPLVPGKDRSYGWGAHTEGRLTVAVVPGTHETVVFEPHVAGVAKVLGREMTV